MNRQLTWNYRDIRGETAKDKQNFFEQLVCHLAALQPDATGEFRRIHGAGGDGGVEALHVLPNGDKIGYQAKYHVHADDIAWKKIDESVVTALDLHATLVRYVVALPCEFTGRRRIARQQITDGTWGTWESRVEAWEALAAQRNMRVEFVPWTGFELNGLLMLPEAQYLLQFFFGRTVFSEEWFAEAARRTRAALQARYSPDDHVPTDSQRPFDVVLRRAPVRTYLLDMFARAARAMPFAAQLLTGVTADERPSPLAAELLLARFAAFSPLLREPLDSPLPLKAWLETYEHMISVVLPLQQWIDAQLAADPDRMQRARELCPIWDFVTEEVFAPRWIRQLPADHLRALLFVGRAGSGKSHALAHAVQAALAEGVPAVHVLGQHIVDSDPRNSILNQLQLDTKTNFSEMLAALNLAAEAGRTRALLVIDGINEGRGPEAWRTRLAGLVDEVLQHDRLVLVLSCREEYVDYLVPEDLVAPTDFHLRRWDTPWIDPGKLMRIEVRGFASADEQENALRQFMDKNGIVRPAPMLLDPELFNPLFLSSVCRSMAKVGKTVLPAGLHGARTLFAFVLDVKCEAFGTPHDGKSALKLALRDALTSLAACMVKARIDHVPLKDCLDILEDRFRALPLRDDTWLDVLAGADILRLDMDARQDADDGFTMPDQVVRFSFQRLQDNLMAQHLMKLDGDRDHAFDGPANWSFLLVRKPNRDGNPRVSVAWPWIGLCGALWAMLADEDGKELVDLPGLRQSPDEQFPIDRLRTAFRTSLHERQPGAFTARTEQLLEGFWEGDWPALWDVRLTFACVPGHAWNADYLDRKLAAFTHTELRACWSCQFDHVFGNMTRNALRSLSWLETAPAGADREILRLGRIMAHWLRQVDDRVVQAGAERALAHLDSRGMAPGP
jgi:hypothetical protein